MTLARFWAALIKTCSSVIPGFKSYWLESREDHVNFTVCCIVFNLFSQILCLIYCRKLILIKATFSNFIDLKKLAFAYYLQFD